MGRCINEGAVLSAQVSSKWIYLDPHLWQRYFFCVSSLEAKRYQQLDSSAINVNCKLCRRWISAAMFVGDEYQPQILWAISMIFLCIQNSEFRGGKSILPRNMRRINEYPGMARGQAAICLCRQIPDYRVGLRSWGG